MLRLHRRGPIVSIEDELKTIPRPLNLASGL